MNDEILNSLFDKYVEMYEPYKLVRVYLDMIKAENAATGKWPSAEFTQLDNDVEIYEGEFKIDEDYANNLATVGGCNLNEGTSLPEFWLNVQKNFDYQMRLLSSEIRRSRVPTEQEVLTGRKKECYIKLFNALQNYPFWVYYDDSVAEKSDHDIFVNQLLTLGQYMNSETEFSSNLFSFQLRTGEGQYTQILLYIGTFAGSDSFSAVGVNSNVWRWNAQTPEELLDAIFREQYLPSIQKRHMENFHTKHITV